jgi:hypothetical protein
MTTFIQLLALLPNILQAIIAVEAVFGVGQGAAKKAAVMNTVTAAGAAGSAVSAKLVSGVGTLIDSSVATMNAAGVIAAAVAPVVLVAVPPAPVPAV